MGVGLLEAIWTFHMLLYKWMLVHSKSCWRFCPLMFCECWLFTQTWSKVSSIYIYIHTLVGANFPIQAWLKVSFHWYNILVSVCSSFKLVEDLIHFYTNGCWFFIQASWRFHSLMHAHWWGLVCCFSFIQDFVYKNVICLIKILDWVMMIFVVPPSVYTLRILIWLQKLVQNNKNVIFSSWLSNYFEQVNFDTSIFNVFFTNKMMALLIGWMKQQNLGSKIV